MSFLKSSSKTSGQSVPAPYHRDGRPFEPPREGDIIISASKRAPTLPNMKQQKWTYDFAFDSLFGREVGYTPTSSSHKEDVTVTGYDGKTQQTEHSRLPPGKTYQFSQGPSGEGTALGFFEKDSVKTEAAVFSPRHSLQETGDMYLLVTHTGGTKATSCQIPSKGCLDSTVSLEGAPSYVSSDGNVSTQEFDIEKDGAYLRLFKARDGRRNT